MKKIRFREVMGFSHVSKEWKVLELESKPRWCANKTIQLYVAHPHIHPQGTLAQRTV